MNLEYELVHALSSNIGTTASKVLYMSVDVVHDNHTPGPVSDGKFHSLAERESFASSIFNPVPRIILLAVTSVLILIGLLLVGRLIIDSEILKITGIVVTIIFIIFAYPYFKKTSIQTIVDTELNKRIKLNEIKSEISDGVYFVIDNSYETLSDFRKERERQARTSYNVAISLISAGIIIVFVGVFLLYRRGITEGSLTSGIGGISSILGATILKLYRETNNRMDSLNDDLFVLNTAKVQYSLILQIQDPDERDEELKKLIGSIGIIKRAG